MDPDSIPRSILTIVLLVFAGAFFAAAETAYSNCSRVRLLSWAEDGNKKARRALSVLDSFDKAIITLLIGNNAVHVVATATATVLSVRLVGAAYGSLLATVVMTLLIFIFSETIPKNIARARADEMTCLLGGPLRMLMVLLTPLSLFFAGISGCLKKLFRMEDEGPAMTEDDFTTMIETIEDEGVLEADESELIQSAVEFKDRTVREILTPRVRIEGLELGDSEETHFHRIMEVKYSRLPVFDHDADHIIGVLNTKQYLQEMLQHPDGYPSVRELMAEPFFIDRDMGLHALVEEMKARKNHLAIVRDPYGGTEGLVTMDDLLEELVGEIWDEDEETPGEEVRR